MQKISSLPKEDRMDQVHALILMNLTFLILGTLIEAVLLYGAIRELRELRRDRQRG
jgi:hypothetical protein